MSGLSVGGGERDSSSKCCCCRCYFCVSTAPSCIPPWVSIFLFCFFKSLLPWASSSEKRRREKDQVTRKIKSTLQWFFLFFCCCRSFGTCLLFGSCGTSRSRAQFTSTRPVSVARRRPCQQHVLCFTPPPKVLSRRFPSLCCVSVCC